MYYRLIKQMCVCEREMINAREISVLLFKKQMCVREMINAREISVLSFKKTNVCVRER